MTTIQIGDKVREADGEYLGVVKHVRLVRLVTILGPCGTLLDELEDQLEIVQPLTEAEAWAELPILVLGQLKEHGRGHSYVMLESVQKSIRHECYKFLGGNGIKVTDEVKERVRSVIRRVAQVVWY